MMDLSLQPFHSHSFSVQGCWSNGCLTCVYVKARSRLALDSFCRQNGRAGIVKTFIVLPCKLLASGISLGVYPKRKPIENTHLFMFPGSLIFTIHWQMVVNRVGQGWWCQSAIDTPPGKRGVEFWTCVGEGFDDLSKTQMEDILGWLNGRFV